MCEGLKNIKRCYSALEYELNKQEALEKISTLHYELKIKNTVDYSDRFLQTATLIQENLSVFNCACNHVDIVTTIMDFLQTIGIELMFDNNLIDNDKVDIIYMMSFLCEEPEIPSFLKAALVNNSKTLEGLVKLRLSRVSNYVIEMIVLDDSDLYAVISYLRIIPFINLKNHKILIQESIKQKFIWLVEKIFEHFSTYLPIFTFHKLEELFTFSLIPKNTHMLSIWSENIATAKVLAMKLNRHITFINAHLEFCCNIAFSNYTNAPSPFDLLEIGMINANEEDKINPNEYIGSVYNLFYNGVWQKPMKDTYWIHNGNTYAQATEEDMSRCIESAKKASKYWTTCPNIAREKVLKTLAFTLECNGKLLLANTVTESINLSKINNVLKYQNEKLEIIGFHSPKDVVSLIHSNEVEIFRYLTLCLMSGSCVIVLCNKNSYMLAPYFDMFATAEIPSGVINLLSNRNMLNFLSINMQMDFISAYNNCAPLKHIILPLK